LPYQNALRYNDYATFIVTKRCKLASKYKCTMSVHNIKFQPVCHQWRVLSAVLFDDVEEYDSKDSFFCRETDIITRATHGQANATYGEENRDEQTSTK